jgi:hypothetical protein
MRPLKKKICDSFFYCENGGAMTVPSTTSSGNSATAQPSGGAGAKTIS